MATPDDTELTTAASTEFLNCLRKGRRNARADLKYCTCDKGEHCQDGESVISKNNICPIHQKTQTETHSPATVELEKT